MAAAAWKADTLKCGSPWRVRAGRAYRTRPHREALENATRDKEGEVCDPRTDPQPGDRVRSLVRCVLAAIVGLAVFLKLMVLVFWHCIRYPRQVSIIDYERRTIYLERNKAVEVRE